MSSACTPSARFITLVPDTRAEELAAEHIIREHHLGRSVVEILDDDAVVGRCSERQIERLLDRPEVLRAVGEDLRELRRSMRSDDRVRGTAPVPMP